MAGVYLAQPVFIPRSISPLNFEPYEGRPEDVLLQGSSDDDSSDTRKRKKRRREQIGTDYLRQQAGYTITFALKGPFEHGWKNPWKQHGVVVDAAAVRDMKRRVQLKQVGKRPSSPIDLTSEPEGRSSDDQTRPTKDRGRAVRNGDKHWLTSNIHSVPQRVSENVDRGSPTPARGRHAPRPTQGVLEENRVDQDRRTKEQVIIDGHQHSQIVPQQKTNSVPSLPGNEYSLEQYYKQLMEGGEMPRCRSPSEELDHSSQEQYRKNGESSIAIHLRELDTLFQDNLTLLEKTTVQDNLAIIRDQINLVHSVADDRTQLLRQKSVLRRYLSHLIKNLLNIKDLPDDNLHRPKKRSRDEPQSPAAGPSIPLMSQKRQKMVNKEVKHDQAHRVAANSVPQLAVSILQTPSHPRQDNARVSREQNGKGRAEEHSIQEEIIQEQAQSPSDSRDSFKASLQTSAQSQEGQGTSKAARKRRRKREEKQKAELEVSGRKQQEIAQNAPRETIRTLIESPMRVEQLEHHSSTLKAKVGVADHKRKFEYLQSTQEIAVPNCNVNKLSVKPSKSNTAREVSKNQQIHKTPKRRTESHLPPQRLITPIIGRGEKDISWPAKSKEDTAVSKGEEVPIICAKDHKLPLTPFQCSTHVRSPSGWKPYKWVPGGQAYAVELLKAHLESVEVGGPDLDPFRRSSQSSSQETSSSEQKPKRQKVEQPLLEPCEYIDAENKVTEPGAESRPMEIMGDDNKSGITGRGGDRRVSVDSVNTAWKKDHAGLFGDSGNDNHRIPNPAPKISPKRSKHLHKSMGSDKTKHKEQEQAFVQIDPEKGNKAADTTPKLPAKLAPKLRSCLKGSKMAAAGLASGSPHVVPASTSISEFEYRRIDKESRSNSLNTQDLEKHGLDTSNPKNAASKRRMSFTSSGHIKPNIEIRVPAIDSKNMHASPCSQEGVHILHALPSPVQHRLDSSGKPVGNLDNPASVTEELPEAQVVVDRPVQLPSAPSTELLETDKSSPKFISTDENGSMVAFSTQAELAKAHELFRQELHSPVKSPTLPTSTEISHPSIIPQDNPSNGRALATPPGNPTESYAGALNPGPDDHEPLSTQAMVDAMSPFVISTIKKPGKFLNALTRPAAAIFGYMGWGSSSQDRGSQSASQQAPAEDLPEPEPAAVLVEPVTAPAQALEPSVDFGKTGLDMETSEDEEGDFDYDLSQPSEFPESFQGVNQDITAILDFEESDYETTTKLERRVRDDQGRWARATPELSQRTPSKMTLRSFSSPHQAESPTQDGQRQTAVEQAIDEAGSFLGTWDVEREIRKMKGSGSGSGEGGGSAAKTSSRAGGRKSG